MKAEDELEKPDPFYKAFQHLKYELELKNCRDLKRKNPNLKVEEVEELALEWIRLLGFNDGRVRMTKTEGKLSVMGLGMLIWFFGFSQHDIKNHLIKHYKKP